VTRLMQVKLWNAPMNEKPTVIHIAPCIAEQCPHKEEIIQKITAKAGIRVIEGTHPYVPKDIFA
jgi:predicted metal-binding protein